MTDRDNEIRQRCEASTPGPWVMSNEPKGSGFWGTIHGTAGVSFSGTRADNEFIAHARTDIPYLLDRVVELERKYARQVEMNEKSNMNDYSELIKALKHILSESDANYKIWLEWRFADKVRHALEALTAENEREKNGNEVLKAERDELHKNNCKLRDTNKALESDNYNLNMNLEHTTAENAELRVAQRWIPEKEI